MFGFIKKFFGNAQQRTVRRYRKQVAQINSFEAEMQKLTDDELTQKTAEFRKRLADGAELDSLLPEAYAVVKNCCRRTCGQAVHVSGYEQQWDMIPYDVQLVGGIAMHHGSIAEMMTGEGKTLTAVLPLYLNALTGKPVHLVTVNDYLVQRDSEWMGTILRKLGLTVGALTNNKEPEERGEIYACDVVYGTASEFGFDYLRDNSMAWRKADQVQRGYFFAIVDEIDSTLIDEARTPLIISGPVEESDSRQMYDELKGYVSQLVQMQRDLTTRIASEARKTLEKHERFGDRETENKKLSKADEAEVQEALKKLWLVSKGTPRHRVLKRAMQDPDLRSGIDAWDLYFHGDPNKQEKQELLAQLFITVDERASEFELTDKGISAWVKAFGSEDARDDFVMFDLGHEFCEIEQDPDLDDAQKALKKTEIQDEDAQRKERSHNLRQLLRAQLLMERDVDYIIQENKIVIIDENTGRPQPGRRFSDGLHSAIEAKEGVEVQKETQTYATITLQNYFRMYTKMAGMTGTALTEAGEFREIYKLEVLEVPTHRPCIRTDSHDEVYMTEREKYTAILKEVREIHEKGCPVLIGTESVEASEKLARIFRQNRLPHTVLNAKHHAQEAEIIADAGRESAITISTNMAGRGTDIKLGEGVAAKGGLHVIGTTRHQSRRIDRQLRGRCARQGDPGASKFYCSFEDNLLRLFASPRLNSMLQRFRPPEGEPISAGILNKSIETAQKRVEARNYTMRKHTLEYDDVMNKQRQEIYSFRNDILHNDKIVEVAIELLEALSESEAHQFCSSREANAGSDPEGYRQWLCRHFPIPFPEDLFPASISDPDDLARIASELIVVAFRERVESENQKVMIAQGIDASTGPKPHAAENAIRNLILRKMDTLWQGHLLAMDHLRSDVQLRSFGQRDPLMEFKTEAFILFDDLTHTLRKDIAQDLFKFRIVTMAPSHLQNLLAKLQMETNRSLTADLDVSEAPKRDQMQTNSPEAPPKIQPIVSEVPKIQRNAPCPCGSGKKYKQCCGLLVPDPVADI